MKVLSCLILLGSVLSLCEVTGKHSSLQQRRDIGSSENGFLLFSAPTLWLLNETTAKSSAKIYDFQNHLPVSRIQRSRSRQLCQTITITIIFKKLEYCRKVPWFESLNSLSERLFRSITQRLAFNVSQGNTTIKDNMMFQDWMYWWMAQS